MADSGSIHRQQVRFEQMRNVEVAELQRLEAREARVAAEKHRRLEQERERRSREVDVARKMAARTVAKNTLYCRLSEPGNAVC